MPKTIPIYRNRFLNYIFFYRVYFTILAFLLLQQYSFFHCPLASNASPLIISSIQLVNYSILLKGWQHEILYYSLSFTVCVWNGYHRKMLAFPEGHQFMFLSLV